MTSAPPAPTVHELFEKHGDFVWRALARSGVRDADLRDATQEVFIVVARRIGEWRGEASITTWLYGIASRVAANFRRRASTRREELSGDLPEGASDSDPEQDLQREQARMMLVEVLESIPEPQRLVFVLFELEEKSCKEIASELALPIGTVFTRLRAARAHFEESGQRIGRSK